jgi:4-nitrophenyl phosphatase
LGLHGQDEVFSSAYASAVYISSVMKLPQDKKVYVIGMSGLEEELRDEGISFLGGTVRDFSISCALQKLLEQ